MSVVQTAIEEQKKQIRQAAQAARAALGDGLRQALSQTIAEKLFATSNWALAKTVCIYIGFRNEVSTDAILDRAWQEGKTVAVPFCCNNQPEKIRLYRLGNRLPLESGSYGILEPTAAWRALPGTRLAESTVDLFVVPGVAFDSAGNRLGWGGGYYDRLLARAPNATKVALAFRCQMVDAVPVGEFDVPLDIIITE